MTTIFRELLTFHAKLQATKGSDKLSQSQLKIAPLALTRKLPEQNCNVGPNRIFKNFNYLQSELLNSNSQTKTLHSSMPRLNPQFACKVRRRGVTAADWRGLATHGDECLPKRAV